MKKSAFTLAEVLITLAIIGVVAAITVPSILASTHEKEFHNKLRKNVSVINNAFRLAQVHEGMMGDNTAMIPNLSTHSFPVSQLGVLPLAGLVKYINTVDYCTVNGAGNFKSCDTERTKAINWGLASTSYLWLADGTIYGIYSTMGIYRVAGLDAPTSNEHMAIWIDVNGEKKPNKWGKDRYIAVITAKDIQFFDDPDAVGDEDAKPSENMVKILSNGK